jgi:hypothetical protein
MSPPEDHFGQVVPVVFGRVVARSADHSRAADARDLLHGVCAEADHLAGDARLDDDGLSWIAEDSESRLHDRSPS